MSHPLTDRSRNLVRFCRKLGVDTMDESFAGDFAFRDAGSRFSILKSVKTAPGPDECFGLLARDARDVCLKLLGLDHQYVGLSDAQQASISPYNSMNYYRSHVVEYFFDNALEPMPPTQGECIFWFAAPDVLCIRYRLYNKSDADVPVRLSWFSQVAPGLAYKTQATPTGFLLENTQSVMNQNYQSRVELQSLDPDVQFKADGQTLRSIPFERVIRPHESQEFRFAVRFGFNSDAFPDWPADRWDNASLNRAIQDSESAYQKLPVLDPDRAHYLDLTLKAAGTLRSLRYYDFDPVRNRRMTIHAGKTGCAATWFWDSGETMPGLGLMQEKTAATGAIRTLIGGIKDDGTPPCTYEFQRYEHAFQIPLLTWGFGHFLSLCPDHALMSEAYPALGRYVRHWLDHYSGPQGLVVYPPGSVSLDDAIRWHQGSPLAPKPGQPWHLHKWGHSEQYLFASPDVNAFLYLELRTLARMAVALGKPAEAAAWDARAVKLAADLNAFLIEPKTKTYQDRHIKTSVFNGIVSTGSFIPVYAGIAPPDVAQIACRDYLLSPDHFLTPFPFPVIDLAHPSFRSGGFLYAPPQYPGSLVQHSYWRGRTWIHANSWLLGALWHTGYHKEADAIAATILDAVNKTEGINECYDSLTGFGNGHPEFMWSSAAVLMIAHRHYRRNAVASL